MEESEILGPYHLMAGNEGSRKASQEPVVAGVQVSFLGKRLRDTARLSAQSSGHYTFIRFTSGMK